MTDVFAQLPRFSWRGTEYPILRRRVSFGHESAQHKLEYRNGALVEQTGAQNLTFSYTLALREDIVKGPYRSLFANGYTQLYIDTRNKDTGPLVDPILGEYPCVPATWMDETDIQKRDGTDVEVEFVHAPEIGDMEVFNLLSIEGLKEDAKRLDQEVERILAENADLFEGTGEPTVNALDAISGAGAQIRAQGDKVTAGLEDFAFKCEKVEREVEALENPRLAGVQRATRRNRENAVRLAKRGADPVGNVKRIKANYDRAIATAAADTDMTVDALIQANPTLARIGYVPAGTILVTNAQKLPG